MRRMSKLSDEARIYARVYTESPLGREIMGTAELLLQLADRLEEECGKNKWIPCGERLPVESLNCVIGWDAYRKRPCLVQRLGGRWISGDDDDLMRITAWRPLPEPYKTEREGKDEV